MQISAIQSFVLLCEDPNISHCSEKLHMSHQGLSRQIRALEQELGVTLFIRSNTGLELTPEGRVLEPMFRTVWEDYEKSIRSLQTYRKTHQTVLTLAVCPGIKTALGLDFFMRFQEENPGIRLDLTFASDVACEEALHEGKVDAAFLDWPIHTDEYESYLVVRSPFVAVMRKDDPLNQKEILTAEDFAGCRVFIPNKTHRMHQRFEEHMPEFYHSVRLDFLSNDYDSFFNDLPKSMGGIAFTFDFLCHHLDPELVARHTQVDIYVELSYCIRNDRKMTPELKRFSEYVYRNVPEVIA